MSSSPIGIFDSGIGGLTVLKILANALPNENIVYFGDTARLPYGEKTQEQITCYSHQILNWMKEEIGVKLVLIACHTSSALALENIKDDFSFPILGTVQPTVEAILQNADEYKRIGIIATPSTAKSKVHEKALLDSGFQGFVHSISCPRFVPLIESGQTDSKEILETAKDYLSCFHTYSLDTLIYGCTHYPLIENVLKTVLYQGVKYVNPAQCMVRDAYDILCARNLLNKSSKKGKLQFYISGNNIEAFSTKASEFLSLSNAFIQHHCFDEDVCHSTFSFKPHKQKYA